MNILTARNLHKSFAGIRAVDGVNLKVKAGQTVSIIGPNGSGKTTTLNLLTGVIRPDSGDVTVNGQKLIARRPEEVAHAGILRTFQNGRVFGNLSVEHNIEIGAHITLTAYRPFKNFAGNPWLSWLPSIAELLITLFPGKKVKAEHQELYQRIGQEIDRFSQRLSPRREHLAYTLSYANRRRTEIARSLIASPKILVLDEPTAGMNQSETAEMTQQLLELKKRGQAILLVEHKLDLVMTLSDWIYVMDGGKVIADGTPSEIQNNKTVIDAYLGKKR